MCRLLTISLEGKQMKSYNMVISIKEYNFYRLCFGILIGQIISLLLVILAIIFKHFAL